MASSKSKSNIPVGRQASGIFPKRNQLKTLGSLTSQEQTRKSISSNRLVKKKSVQLNAPNEKSITSLVSKRLSTTSDFDKNKNASQSAISLLSSKKDTHFKLSSGSKIPKKIEERSRRNSPSSPVKRSQKSQKEEKIDNDILEVYRIEEGYAESEIQSLPGEEFDNLQECGDNFTKKGDINMDLTEKFSIITGSGQKLCQDFVTYLEQIRLESPGDGSCFREKCLSGLKELEEKINNDLKKKKLEFDAYIMKMKVMSVSDVQSTAILEDLEKEKLQLKLCIESYKNKLDEAEKRISQMQEIPKHIVQELQITIDEQDKEIQRIININKSLEEHKKGVDMKNEVLLRELSQCEIRISQFKGENEDLKENLINIRTRTYKEIESDYKELLDSHNTQREQMKRTIDENYKQIDELKAELEKVKDNHNDQLSLDLETLKLKHKELETQYEALLDENKNMQESKTEIDKTRVNYDETITKLKKERDEALLENDELRNALNEKDEYLEHIVLTKSDDQEDKLRQELHKLHLQNANLAQENEELKKHSLRMRVECRAAEETNIMNQRLLKIRGELVKYFHESKDKCSIHDIYPGLAKSNATIDNASLNFNDLQKLSSTLDTKDTDIASKVHMIRYLEDNENRYKRTISKLRDYNSRLESENTDLKRLLRMDSQIS